MKAKTFENLIRKVVREEIDYALRREIKTLKEDLRDELKPTIIEHKTNLVEVSNENPTTQPVSKHSLREKIMGTKPIKQKRNFVSDGTLNDLLNETAMGDTNTQSSNSPVSLSKPFASGAPMSMDTTGMPPEVANAVTRDYSSLMKAIDNKKNN
tara:strand:+ start:3586 stop:4047 length:462 start_codon:yes stop_codon:yes gene_type:complete